MPEDQRAKLSMVGVVLNTMEEAGARGIPISPQLADAIPVIAAKLMTHRSLKANERGARLAQAGLNYNLARFAEANKTQMERVEKTLNAGDTYNIVINPPPGATGGLPFPVTKPKKVANEAK